MPDPLPHGTKPEILVRCLFDAAGEAPAEAFFSDDDCTPEDALERCFVLLGDGGEARARERLASGAAGVLIGEAALRDAEIVTRLAGEFGSQRIGVLVPCARMQVSWRLDTESNADFNIMRPSICEPSLEVLTAGARRTGTLAPWWIERMIERGAGPVLVRADFRDDTDLNLCADLVERFGERLWIGPLRDEQPPLGDLAALAGVARFALPPRLFREDEQVLAWRGLGEPNDTAEIPA